MVQGSQFEFVAPGGQTTIRYDPPEPRRAVGEMSGESLMQPGKRIRLSDFAGKVVVLNVWGSWCGPCRAEMPEMQQVVERTRASGVQLLGIDVRDPSRDAAVDLVHNLGITYPSIYDPPGRSLLAIFLKPLLAEDLLPVARRLAAEQPEAALLFVLGFTVVFLLAVVAVLGVSDALLRNELLLQRIGGVITIGMGLVFIGLVPVLQRDIHLRRVPRGGIAAAPVMGAVYGLGWTPCLGPTLTGVIALASGTQVGSTTARGIVLVLAYCLGLGLPFVLLAVGASWAVRTASWLRRHARGIQLFGGAMLIVVGALLVTGLWAGLVGWLRGPIAGFTTPI